MLNIQRLSWITKIRLIQTWEKIADFFQTENLQITLNNIYIVCFQVFAIEIWYWQLIITPTMGSVMQEYPFQYQKWIYLQFIFSVKMRYLLYLNVER
jgi:hypothetical protein